MTHKTARFPRSMFFASASLQPMLRGPQVFYAPDEPETPVEEVPEEFREQPGDREGGEEPAAEPEPEAEDEAEEEAEPEPDPEPEGETEEVEASEEQPPRKTDWKDRQIAKLRERERAKDQELADAKRRAEAAEALLAAPSEEREAGLTDAARETIRKEEAAKLTEKAYFERINTGLENMDAAGSKSFAATWAPRIEQAREALADEMIARPDFLEAVTDLPNAAAVYHELAGDLDHMEAVLKMPAHKMGMELARLSDKLAKPVQRQVSKAPKPITPIERGGSERDLDELINDPNASMEDIERRMRAEEAKRAKAH